MLTGWLCAAAQQDVGRREFAVHDPDAVKVLEPLQDARTDALDLVLTKGRDAVLDLFDQLAPVCYEKGGRRGR